MPMSESARIDYRTAFTSLVGEVLNESVAPSDHFVDAGGDSMTAAIVVNIVVERDGIVPPLDWFFEENTLQDVADRCYDEIHAVHGSSRDGGSVAADV
jgi:hypothetical protein